MRANTPGRPIIPRPSVPESSQERDHRGRRGAEVRPREAMVGTGDRNDPHTGPRAADPPTHLVGAPEGVPVPLQHEDRHRTGPDLLRAGALGPSGRVQGEGESHDGRGTKGPRGPAGHAGSRGPAADDERTAGTQCPHRLEPGLVEGLRSWGQPAPRHPPRLLDEDDRVAGSGDRGRQRLQVDGIDAAARTVTENERGRTSW